MTNKPSKVTSSDLTKEEKGAGGNNKKGGFRFKAHPPIPRPAKFEGKCAELKGQIYDCSHAKQADQYAKTTKEHVDTTYRHDDDIRLAVLNLEPPEIPRPADLPTNANGTQKAIWTKAYRAVHRPRG
jgi:hypothetical protein